MAVREVAANAAAETAPEEPGRLGGLVVIEPDEGKSKSHDEEAEDHEASYLEA